MSRHRAEAPRAPWQVGAREALTAAGLDPYWVRELLVRGLSEDLGPGWVDITTSATVPVGDLRRAQLIAQEDCVVAGLILWPIVLAETAARLEHDVPVVRLALRDGTEVRRGELLAEAEGLTSVLVVAERTMLNLLRHLSGVATYAGAWASALAGSGVRLLDTRSTTAGLRALERYAVRCGGGSNGRVGLYDAAHVTIEHAGVTGSIITALDAVRRRLPGALVQVDVRTATDGVAAVHSGARFVVCEHMAVDQLPICVAQIRAATSERVEVAASGHYSLRDVAQLTRSGVDHIYVDGLVRNAIGVDITHVLR